MNSRAMLPPYAMPLFNNPFAEAAVVAPDVAGDAPEGSYTYALVKSGPDMASEECEVTASALEVRILWETTVLHVAHLNPPCSFYLGEDGDYLIPVEKLGSRRAPLVLVGDDGTARIVLLPGAAATITMAGEAAISEAEARQRGVTSGSPEVAGADELLLPAGASVSIALEGFCYEIAAVKAGRANFGRRPIASQSFASTAVSALVHLGLLGAFALFTAPLGATDDSAVAEDQRYQIQQALAASAEKEIKEIATLSAAGVDERPAARDMSQPSPGTPGALGNPGSQTRRGRVAVMGPEHNESPRLGRSEVLAMAGQFGVIDLIRDPNAPASAWSREDSLGRDPMSARGNMWMGDIHDAGGPGGLALSGDGDGSDSAFSFITQPGVRTIGRDTASSFFARRPGGLLPGHKSTGPNVRPMPPVAGGTGHLPPELIQRTVRQNFGRFRACYEGGLRSNPELAGRVAVRFVIGRDGAVSSVGNGGSDLADASVVSCVTRAFYGLSFTPPEAGIVTVVYPILFTPG